MSNLKNKMIELGGKEWVKGDMERVYIDCEIFNILREELHEGDFFQPVNLSDKSNKFFFDVKANAVMRSHKNKKPTIEIQY